jgi:hypothetical protein
MPADIPTETEVTVSDSLAATEVDGEAVVLSFDSGEYYGLNGVAADIWTTLEDGATVGELQESVVDEYDVDPDRCRSDLEPFLAELAEEGLVELGNADAP